MQPSPEQFAFYREIEYGTENVILESVAGSGKTTSIVNSLDYVDDEWPILCCSFTSLAAGQLGAKIKAKGFRNVNSSTLNSVGWSICRANVPKVELDKYKTLNILEALLQRANLPEGIDSARLFNTMKGTVRKLVSLLKAYAIRPEQDLVAELDRIANYHGVELPEGTSLEANYARLEVYNWTIAVFMRSVQVMQYMDYDDQKYFPVIMNWHGPDYKLVYIDECQDCNVCDLQLIKLISTDRYVFVGDTMQAIYLFRGSLLNAIESIREEFNCKYLTLSVCWRCAEDILEEPKRINKLIRGPENNPKGKGTVAHVTTPEFLDRVGPGDFVICRTTAPLIKRCLQLIRRGKPAKVKGREVGRGLLDLIKKVGGDLDRFSRPALLEFVGRLDVYRVETVEMYEKAKREDAAERVSDECEALKEFCMEAQNLNGVHRKIDSLFVDDEDSSSVVLLLTGHKSKGLENRRVWFLRPDLCPSPMAKSPHEQEAERRLRYVILTRAEHERYHVTPEKDELKPARPAW